MREGSPIGAIILGARRRTPIHRQADRARHHLRRPGGDRDRERAPVRRGPGAHARATPKRWSSRPRPPRCCRSSTASPGNLAPVFEAMLAKATQLCNAQARHYVELQWRGFHDRRRARHAPPSTVFGDMLLRPGPTTALGRVQREKRVLHIPDMMDEEAYPGRRPAAGRLGRARDARKLARRPVAEGGKAPGGHSRIYRGEVRPFTDKEIALVTSFAEQAVIAIENVRLFEEVQARTRELHGIARIPDRDQRSAQRHQPLAFRVAACPQYHRRDRGPALRSGLRVRVPAS